MKFFKSFLSKIGVLLDNNKNINLLVEIFTPICRQNIANFTSNDSRNIYLHKTIIEHVHIYAHAGAYDFDFAPNELEGYKIDSTNQILSLQIKGSWKDIYFGPDHIAAKQLNDLISRANEIMEKYNVEVLLNNEGVIYPNIKNKGILKKFKFTIKEEKNAWKAKCIKWPKKGDLAECINRNNMILADLMKLNDCLSIIPSVKHQKAVYFRTI
jgi:hypothetical protein